MLKPGLSNERDRMGRGGWAGKGPREPLPADVR